MMGECKWSIGVLCDNKVGLSGLSIRRPFQRMAATEVWWKTDAGGEEIADRLRELAAFLDFEGEEQPE